MLINSFKYYINKVNWLTRLLLGVGSFLKKKLCLELSLSFIVKFKVTIHTIPTSYFVKF